MLLIFPRFLSIIASNSFIAVILFWRFYRRILSISSLTSYPWSQLKGISRALLLMNWVISLSQSLKERKIDARLHSNELSKELLGFYLKLLIWASIILTKVLVETAFGPILNSSLSSSVTSHFYSSSTFFCTTFLSAWFWQLHL
jgi:hypothetical protein